MTMNNEEKETIYYFAKKIVEKGLAVPAIFLFESTKYISFVAGQTLIFLGPILTFFPMFAFLSITLELCIILFPVYYSR